MSDSGVDSGRRRSGLRTIILGSALVLVVLVVVAVVATRREAGPLPTVSGSGQEALPTDVPAADEAFALPAATLDGFAGADPINLADYRGEPLVVNFWATWCAPCVKEMPEFQEVASDLRDEVTFVGIDVEDAPPNAEPFVERLGIDYPLAVDPRREFARSVNIFGMPTTLFVDGDGIVRYRYTGPLDGEQLRDLLAEHLDVRA